MIYASELPENRSYRTHVAISVNTHIQHDTFQKCKAENQFFKTKILKGTSELTCSSEFTDKYILVGRCLRRQVSPHESMSPTIKSYSQKSYQDTITSYSTQGYHN